VESSETQETTTGYLSAPRTELMYDILLNIGFKFCFEKQRNRDTISSTCHDFLGSEHGFLSAQSCHDFGKT